VRGGDAFPDAAEKKQLPDLWSFQRTGADKEEEPGWKI
jgi:hypothetical protein